mgnify:CR=1 FL=1
MIAFLLKLFTDNPLSMLWIAGGIALAAFIAGGSAAWTVQGWRLDAVKAEYAAFVTKVKAVGDAQNAATKLKDAENKTRMEKANADRAKKTRDLDRIYAEYQRLRDTRAGGGNVSSAPTFAPSVDRTIFDSQELVGAIRVLETGVLGIIQQGDQAIADLNTAKDWAKPN